MTIQAGELLLRQVRPILRASLARGAVRPVGCEDLEELAAEADCQAASMIEAAEKSGKELLPNSVAYYTLQALRSGRRFGCASRTDVMSPATQLDGRCVLVSMDEPVFIADLDGDDDEPDLHDCLAASGEDGATVAARAIDWEAAAATLENRELEILGATAAGLQGTEIAAAFNVSTPRITQIKRAIGDKLRYELGSDVLAACVCDAPWQRGMRSYREKRACRYDDRAATRKGKK